MKVVGGGQSCSAPRYLGRLPEAGEAASSCEVPKPKARTASEVASRGVHCPRFCCCFCCCFEVFSCRLPAPQV